MQPNVNRENPDQTHSFPAQQAIELWLQSLSGLVGSMAEPERSAEQKEDLSRVMTSQYELAVKLMQKSFQNVQSPPPDIFPDLAGAWGREIIDYQFRLLGKMASFFNADPKNGNEAFRAWNAFYDKEIKPLLNLPQVGLARYYQERSNQLVDKFASWNKASIEFLHMVSSPFEESLGMLQREMEMGDQANRFTEGLKALYQIWIKQLDASYQSLFRSPDFIKCLSDTLDALEDFVKARMEYVHDLGKAMQLPTMKDLDEAYRELYLLKKEVKAIKSRDRERGKTVKRAR